MARMLCGEIYEIKSDLEEAIGQRGADGETTVVYAVATTLRSYEGEGDEWYVP